MGERFRKVRLGVGVVSVVLILLPSGAMAKGGTNSFLQGMADAANSYNQQQEFEQCAARYGYPQCRQLQLLEEQNRMLQEQQQQQQLNFDMLYLNQSNGIPIGGVRR